MRPFTFTHDRDFDRRYDGHPGRFSPDGRLIAVGLKEQGFGSGMRRPDPGRPAARWRRAARSRRSPSPRTDERWQPSPATA